MSWASWRYCNSYGVPQQAGVVFKQTFVGDGVSNQFTVTNTENATFQTGVWNSGNILVTLTTDITKVDGSILYDSILPFVRHRISVVSINNSGLVTLDYIPRNGESFIIWYWYALLPPTILVDYVREDYVSKMEDREFGTASDILFDNMVEGVLIAITVQSAIDELTTSKENKLIYNNDLKALITN